MTEQASTNSSPTPANSSTAGQIIASGPSRRPSRKLIVGVLIGVVIVAGSIIGGKYGWQYFGDRASTVGESICSDALISRASEGMMAQNFTVMRGVVAQVTELDNYQADINCNYIVAYYHIITEQDSTLAIERVQSIDDLLSRGVQYSELFDPPAMTPDTLRELQQSVGGGMHTHQEDALYDGPTSEEQ